MLRSLRALLAIMRNDPTIASELTVVRSLSLRTFKWILISEFFLTLQFVPIKFFIDELTSSDPDLTKLLLTVLVAMTIHILGVELRRVMIVYRSQTMWRMWRVWWGYGHRRELRLSSDWHTAHGTGEKESVFGKNIYRFEVMVETFMFDAIPAFMRIVFSGVMMFVLGWQYGLLVILTGLVFGLVLRYNEKKSTKFRKAQHGDLKRLERYGTELTSNWRTIKAMGREEDFADKNDEMLMRFWYDQQPRDRRYVRYDTNQLNVLELSKALLYAGIAYLVIGDISDVGSAVLAITIMERVYQNFMRFNDLQRTMNEGVVAMTELIEIMSLPPTVKQADEPMWPASARGQVTFDGIVFAYPDDPKCSAIKDFSLKIEPYTTAAFVGASGSGKSTLMSLLQREYDPTKGAILIDDIDLRQLDYGRYRKEMVGVVSQNIELFDATIIENIRLSKPSATDEEVIAAAKAAHAHEFVRELKNGYNTVVGEDGIRLSGGQRQRIAIARALLRKPAILILDEATSALDAESQAKVQLALNELIAARELTIFIVAHRLSTIKSADQVVVMEKGHLAEMGTHAELEKRNGLYARLRKMESEGLLG